MADMLCGAGAAEMTGMQNWGAGEKIAIIGSGGIGGYLAAQLHDAGHEVVLCVRTPFEKLVIVEKDGAERTVPVRIASDPAAEKSVKWLLMTTKAQDVPGASAWLEQLAGPDTITAVIQNGIDHESRVQPYLPDGSAILPAIINCSVERTQPGRIVHHGAATISIPAGRAAERFASLFNGTVFEIRTEDDFTTVAWLKLLSNAMANPLTALTLRRLSVLGEPQMAELALAVGREVVAVARAVGAKLSDDHIDPLLAGIVRNHTVGTSMLYDRLSGRPLEFAFITGAVVAAAEKAGIDVPVNRTIRALLSGASGHALDGSE
jgi:2-dehydropantoate 2-reductase